MEMFSEGAQSGLGAPGVEFRGWDRVDWFKPAVSCWSADKSKLLKISRITKVCVIHFHFGVPEQVRMKKYDSELYPPTHEVDRTV